jgi:hypothetical protein
MGHRTIGFRQRGIAPSCFSWHTRPACLSQNVRRHTISMPRSSSQDSETAFGQVVGHSSIRSPWASYSTQPSSQYALVTLRGTDHPAAGKAGIARPLAIEYHCPGLPEPGR